MDIEVLFSNEGLVHISERIFGFFTFQDLVNCLVVSKQWNKFISSLKSKHEMIIIHFAQQHVKKNIEWPNIISAARKIKSRNEIKILVEILQFYKSIRRPKKFSLKLWTPFYVSCWENKIDYVEFMLPFIEVKNPQIANNSSIYHVMAREGLFEVCQCIIKHLGNTY